MIQFKELPASRRTPGVNFEFDIESARRGVPANHQKVLVIGQKLDAGSLAALKPYPVYSEAEAAAYAGYGSMAHLMVRALYKAAARQNPNLDVTLILLEDDAGGVKAEGTITIEGPSTGSGAFTLYIGSQSVRVAIANGDTASDIASALSDAIALRADLPVTAAVDGAELTFTARNKGLCGNDIGIGYRIVNAPGVSATVVAMSGGVTNPDPALALTEVYPERYHIIVYPYNNADDLATIRDHLDIVGSAIQQRPGVVWYGQTGSVANAVTLASGCDSGRMYQACCRYTASQQKAMPFEIAAAWAAQDAAEEDPAMPIHNLQLYGLPVPEVTDRYTDTEVESMLWAGCSYTKVEPGEKLMTGLAISTYMHNSAGVTDDALLHRTTIKTLDYFREALVARISTVFGRSKFPPRVLTALPEQAIDVAKTLEEMEILQDIDANKSGFIAERDTAVQGRARMRVPAPCVPGLYQVFGKIDLIIPLG